MARQPSVEPTDAPWKLIQPHLPAAPPRPRGGRPRADDRACVEGILWVLSSGARWRDLPERYPSPGACWRRLDEWELDGVLEANSRAFLDTLDERGLIDWDETFVDGTFAPEKKRATKSAKRSEEKVRSWPQLRMVREFRAHAGACLPARQRSRWRKESSRKSPSARGRPR